MEQVAACYFVVSDGMAAIDFEVFGVYSFIETK